MDRRRCAVSWDVQLDQGIRKNWEQNDEAPGNVLSRVWSWMLTAPSPQPPNLPQIPLEHVGGSCQADRLLWSTSPSCSQCSHDSSGDNLRGGLGGEMKSLGLCPHHSQSRGPSNWHWFDFSIFLYCPHILGVCGRTYWTLETRNSKSSLLLVEVIERRDWGSCSEARRAGPANWRKKSQCSRTKL